MVFPEPDLSAAELATLRDMEARLAAQDPALDRTLRTGAHGRLSAPARLTALLLAGSAFIGGAALLGGGQAALAAALGVMAVVVGVNVYRLRRW